jgi:hypothetical protein
MRLAANSDSRLLIADQIASGDRCGTNGPVVPMTWSRPAGVTAHRPGAREMRIVRLGEGVDRTGRLSRRHWTGR